MNGNGRLGPRGSSRGTHDPAVPGWRVRCGAQLFTSFDISNTAKTGDAAETARVLGPAARYSSTTGIRPGVAELYRDRERTERYGCHRMRRHDPDTCRVEKTIRIRSCGCEREFSESVRLYTLAEMTAMLDGAGLALEGADGSNEGEPYSESSARMILRGRKR